ncbi:endo-1,4-beta-xylanase [Clostridium bornimense]|uniref:endo-1,4-beta-xylanase n=1 Tax=Clostridium bornimense TaxID=1216932 RepID=UPI001C1044CA|nr:endo-1,4-beta-xylanase [Clostridium bornimense]MBU5315235.1 endo-1,4-beta-xylanase [Clostridium bornimense]
MKKVINFILIIFMLTGIFSNLSIKVFAASNTIADGWYYIKNVNAQKYLQVKDSKAKNAQNVNISKGTKANNQKWYVKNLGNGYVTIKSALGEYMVDIANGTNKDHTNVQIYSAYSGNAQQFAIKATATKNVYTIATKVSSGKRGLDAAGAKKVDGTNVIQYTLGKNKKNQEWKFESANDNNSNDNNNSNSNSNNNSNSTNNSVYSKDSLKGAYSNTYGKVGSAVNLNQLQDSKTLEFIKKHYNSITMENEMKPDALLGYNPTKITVAEAKKKGYIIPDGYKEQYVPEINYAKIDKVLQIAKDNNLSVRFHTLVWHSQTPDWFFKNNFSNSQGLVSKSTMDGRLEYYIKNVMAHVHSSKYSDVVYAWDVVNEYLHSSNNNSNWIKIYGNEGEKSTLVKKSFTYANDMLNYYKVRNRVKLFYNDYNTYQIPDKIVNMIKFVNSNGTLCDGVGMQSHLGLTWPSVSYVGEAVEKFKNAKLEIQITELDVKIGDGNSINAKESEQAKYYSDLMKMLNGKKKNGANITGITFWGLSDNVSWIRNGYPLLFSDINKPKKAYYSVIEASSNY